MGKKVKGDKRKHKFLKNRAKHLKKVGGKKKVNWHARKLENMKPLNLKEEDPNKPKNDEEKLLEEQDNSEFNKEIPKAAKKKKNTKKVLKETQIKEEKEIDEIEQHKRDLEQLKSTHADFFEFLQKEDDELLKFGEDEDDDEEEEQQDSSVLNMTKKKLEELKQSVEGLNFQPFLKLLRAYTHACDIKNDKEQEKVKFMDSEVFNDILVYSLSKIPELFTRFLLKGTDEELPQLSAGERNIFVPTKYLNWSDLKPYIFRFVKYTFNFLDSLTSPPMILFVLKETEKFPHFIAQFPKYYRLFLKLLFEQFGEGDDTVKIRAFLNIRSLAMHTQYENFPRILQGTYNTYVKNSKTYNHKTYAMNNFMINCLVELFGIDIAMSYQTMFVYLQQISIHLRSAFTSATKRLTILNWQMLNSIRAWVKILCAYSQSDLLWKLSFPLIQIINGVISLVPGPTHYPLVLHYIGLLVDLSKARSTALMSDNDNDPPQSTSNNNIFIPTAQLLINILVHPMWEKSKAPKSQTKAFTGEIQFILTVKEKDVQTIKFRDSILQHVHDLLLDYFTCYARSPAYPELVLLAKILIKKMLREKFKHTFQTMRLNNLMEKLHIQSQYVTTYRNKFGCGPSDTAKLQTFMEEVKKLTPLEEYRHNIAKEARSAFLDKMKAMSQQVVEGDQKDQESKGEKMEEGDDIVDIDMDELFEK